MDLKLLPAGAIDNPGTSRFLLNTIDLLGARIPVRPAGYRRISSDPRGLERGIDAQAEDVEQKAKQLGWPAIVKWYTENDTSAFKKKRVRLADGSVGYRNIRPAFMEMLKDLASGEIDGVIVYDQDRLQRQPRDLEDLIDLCERLKFPVVGISSAIDLLTSQGRMQARIVAAFNLKSSEDTSRRVARMAVADAKRGTTVRGGPRRFGWYPDAETVNPEEKVIVLEIRDRIMRGESKSTIALDLQARGVPTVSGKEWTTTTVNTIMRNPRLAGIRAYSGVYHGEKRPSVNDWWERTVKIDGEYVIGSWETMMTPDEWEALQYALDGRREKYVGSNTNGGHGRGNPKHLLTGLVFCGVCGCKMVGRVMAGRTAYGCRPKDLGGCNSVSRNQGKVDNLILHTAIQALRKRNVNTKPAPTSSSLADALREIEEIEQRKAAVKAAWRAGRYADKDYFDDVAAFNAQLEVLHGRAATSGQIAMPTSPKALANELESVDTPTERKRALLAELFERIVINKSSRGPHFTPEDIVPVWRPSLAE